MLNSAAQVCCGSATPTGGETQANPKTRSRKGKRLLRVSELPYPPARLPTHGVPDQTCLDWILVCVDEKPGGVRAIDCAGGERVFAYGIRIAGMTAWYAHIENVGAINGTTAQRVAAIMKGMKCTDVTQTCDADIYACNTEVVRIPTWQGTHDMLNTMFPSVKVASNYHQHLLPSEVLVMAGKVKRESLVRKVITVLARVKGSSVATLASWMLWALSVDVHVVLGIMNMIYRSGLTDLSTVTTLVKKLSVRAKQLQHSASWDLTQVFELDVLANRGIGAVDWEEEKRNRTELKIVDIPADEVRRRAYELFMKGKQYGFDYKKKSWSEWWDTRWLSTPNGSANTDSSVMAEYRERVKKVDGFGKKILLSSIKYLPFEHFINRPERIVARPSIKYEWGKQRAIYGTDVESYVLADLAYPDCEQAVPPSISIGKYATEKHIKRYINQVTPGMMPFCFDYEDFNSQHSASSMRAVMEAFRMAYGEDMSNEQYQAALWSEKSVEDSVVVANQTMGIGGYKTKGTLFSGWRLTTMVNSVLNKVYLDWCGSTKHADSCVHSGDDVFVVCQTIGDADRFLKAAHQAGIRAQPDKAATGSIAEFLRIDHRGAQTASQYIARTVSTLTHSRVESNMALKPQDMIDANKMRLKDYTSRCGNPLVAELIDEHQRKRTSRVFRTEMGVLEAYERLHPLEGGAGDMTEPEGQKIRYNETPPALDSELLPSKVVEPGAADFARWVQRKMPAARGLGEHVFRACLKATDLSYRLVRRTIRLEPYRVTEVTLREYSMFGAWKPLAKTGMGNLLKGLDPGLVKLAAGLFDSHIERAISESRNPVRLANVYL